jgi:sodium-dependent phosphate cotransporter
VTTSLVVPLVAKKVVKLRKAVPFILGANIGTTLTAFIAAMFNSNTAISIAIAHFLFNFIGVLIFFPIPFIKDIPVKLALGLGRLTIKYRLAGFLYVILMFFFIPFSLIYFNKDAVSVRELTYEKQNFKTQQKEYYKIITKTYKNQTVSSWSIYEEADNDQDPSKIISVYRKRNTLFINNELYELNKPGFCKDGEDETGKYRMCVREILEKVVINPSLSVDSVYVFEKQQYKPSADSIISWSFISATQNILVKRETHDKAGNLLLREELFSIEKK